MKQRDQLSVLLLLLCLFAYSLPWVITPGASHTLNAYDLAEWSGLIPEVRGSSIPLVPPLLLRLLLFLMTLWFGQIPTLPSGLRLIITLGIAAALLPPPEFFAGGFRDPNFRQQFTLAVLTTLASSLIYLPLPAQWRAALRRIAIVSLILISSAGWVINIRLLRQYQSSVQFGFGGGLLIGLVVLAGIWELKTNEATLKAASLSISSLLPGKN